MFVEPLVEPFAPLWVLRTEPLALFKVQRGNELEREARSDIRVSRVQVLV